MPYSEKLAERIRKAFEKLPNVEEKKMMGGLVFMYKGRMCVGIIKDELMCRIDPELYEQALSRKGCRKMEFTGRALKGYVLIDDSGIKAKKDFDYWIGLALDFNSRAKASKKLAKK